MLDRLALPGDSQREVLASRSVTFGVSRRWPEQQLASIPGIQIAISTDLLDTSELKALINRNGVDAAILTTAELLAWGYKLQGMEFLSLLTGAFAIALWDENAQRLVLVVDRFGINPLYWSVDGERLWFASRPGAIPAARETTPDIDPAAVVQFLLHSTIPAPLSIYQGITRIKPGHFVVFERGSCREECYWDMRYEESSDGDEKYWAGELQQNMRAAVRRHLVGCDPEKTGAYLSGGTDSSSVVAFMGECQSRVNSFSIYFANPRYSEIAFARTAAQHFNTRHFEKALTPADALLAIDKVAQYYDEPFANSSAIGGYHCALLARQNGIDTLLGGDGGDELFAGNERYATDKQFQIYHSIPRFLRRGLLEPVARMLPDNGVLSFPQRYIKRAGIANPARIYSYSFFLSNAPAEIFENDFLDQVPREGWLGIAENHFNKLPVSELNRFLYMDLKMTLSDNDIPKVSGTAEMAGVRARFPLLDHRLAEFSGRIPTRLKLKGLQKRYIFKQAMKGILPATILHKKKHGFGVPLATWFLQDPKLNAFMREVLHDPRTRQRGIFRPQFLEHLMDLHRHDHTIYYGEIIWYLMVLELWQRRQASLATSLAAAR
jgi:asparagine synthase (glutamine-hydrolysing)